MRKARTRQSGGLLRKQSVRQNGSIFVLAYLTILLATALGGGLIVRHFCDSLWETRREQLATSASYAADSLLSFVAFSGGVIEGAQRASALSQIEEVMDESVSEVRIEDVTAAEEDARADHEGVIRVIRKARPAAAAGAPGEAEENGSAADTPDETDAIGYAAETVALEASVRLSTGTRAYDLTLRSNVTDLVTECDRFWRNYRIIACVIAAVSGSFLFALKKMYDEAEKRNRFLADFTHELKTPMTAIMGYAKMLRTYDLTREERTDAGEAIYREAKRLEDLSARLLELYVLQNETPKLSAVKLSEIEKNINRTLSFLSDKYHVTFHTSLPEVTVLTDETLLFSLFYNLSDNAAKASPYGAEIMLGGEKMQDKVKIFIKDEGYGIEKEHIARLTEPFYREDKARSRKQGGAGLGLSLCREIAALHGSRLVIESEKGAGTTVSFLLQKAEVRDA